MKTTIWIFALAALAVVLLSGTMPASAADSWQMPTPGKEHKWLQRFVGEWQSDVKMFAGPGNPPMKSKSTEKVRAVGGFWVVSESKSEAMGVPFTSVFTVGYDPEKKQYVGTWVDSTSSMLWHYVGTVDATGKKLELEADGPMQGDRVVKFKEVTEFKSKDHKVFTALMQEADGTWTTLVTMDSRRKKSK